MLFRRLLEHEGRAPLRGGVGAPVVSVLAHAVVIGGGVVASLGAPPRPLAESFSSVAFFLPRDRVAGTRARATAITYVPVASSAGREGAAGRPAAPGPAPVAVAAPGPDAPAPSAPLEPEPAGDSVMTALEVDSAAARYDDSAAPPYPASLLERKLEGTVGIQYVVDTTGQADTTSVQVLSATHEDFAASVRATLPRMRFRPAVMNGRKVRQLVQQLFAFRIDTGRVAAPRPPERP